MPSVEVISQVRVGEGLYQLTFRSPVILSEETFAPGQFLHIRVSDAEDLLLRRPISLCRAHVQDNTLTVLYRAQGQGTRRLTRLKSGDTVDVLGPLGHGFPVHAQDRQAVLIGGGVGVPPLVELAHKLTEKGQRVLSVVGFQTATQAILIEELATYGAVVVCSDDGSIGQQGLVTVALTQELLQDVDRFYACGPTPMLKAIQAVMRTADIPGYLSLEERMGCGIGLCAACVHPVLRQGQEKYVKTCYEGPVFPTQEVLFS